MPNWPYPVFLDLSGKRAMVIGGGALAEEKARGLEAAGAIVSTVAAAEWQEELLDGCFIVVAATFDTAFNARVFAAAEQRRVLVNAIDDPPHCRFIFPAIHRQGDLAIAISTNGKCPAASVRIKEQLAGAYGPEYGEFLAAAGGLRSRIKQAEPEFEARRALWYALIDSPALDALRRGDRAAAVAALESLITAREEKETHA
jgi:siroheme synthase-like protein